MKNLKKLLTLSVMATMLVGAMAGCGSDAPAPTTSGEEGTYNIGISQYMAHPSLDAAAEGFIDGLAEAGYVEGENITIDFQNAQGDLSNSQTIAQKFVTDDCDLVLAVATTTAQSLANLTKEMPILVTAVTDPADAKLVASNEAPGGNVTGTSDLTPIKQQIELLAELAPEAKNIAMLYSSSEPNSLFQIEIAHGVCDDLGLTYVDATVSSSNEIQQVVQSLVGKVDAIYIPTDNTIASAMANVAMVAIPAKLPVVTGAPAMAEDGGLASIGVDYYALGELTATQAVAILEGESVPADMPIQYIEDPEVYINEDYASQIGLTLPEGL